MDQTPAPIFVTIDAAQAGLRIDRALAGVIGTISRTRVKGLIEEGFVTRDGVRVSEPAEPAREGVTYQLAQPAPVSAIPLPQSIPLPILFEDRDLLVLDKPAGLVVHPAPGNEDGTLVNALLAHCGDSLPGIGGERRPGIVHRLDKDTSGVMVVAKNERTLAALSAMFAERDIDRFYLALIWGLPSPGVGEIEGNIGRDPHDRKRMAVVEKGGRHALTRYRLLEQWQGAASLIECRLATGRTHQIRVHLASKSHPVVGDPLYLKRVPAVSKSLSGEVRGKLLDFPRQALHAARLGFKHPRTGEDLNFETPIPADFQALLDALRGN